MKSLHSTLLATLALTVLACESSSDSDGGKLANLNIPPSANANLNTSYSNFKTGIHINYMSIPAPEGALRDAIAYLDVEGDGDTDVFLATGEYLLEGEIDSILALNDGSESFTSSTTEFSGNMPPATHARKTLVSDFNGDDLKDLFVLDHGFDNFPFPGAQTKLIMQIEQGKFSWSKLPDVGFFHGGAAADIDNDGDIDIFVGGHDPFFYINDGNANFTRVDDRFDAKLKTVFSAELIDIEGDGYVDLLVGAHENDGDPTRIYWGNPSGAYRLEDSTTLPVLPPFGAILDFDAEDIDQDGDRDLIINRTRDSATEFYVGWTLQVLRNDGSRQFIDVSQTQIANTGTGDWFPWVRLQDMDADNDIDIMSDDAGFNIYFENNGSGFFTKIE